MFTRAEVSAGGIFFHYFLEHTFESPCAQTLDGTIPPPEIASMKEIMNSSLCQKTNA